MKFIKTRNQGNLKISGETNTLQMFRQLLTKIPTVVSAVRYIICRARQIEQHVLCNYHLLLVTNTTNNEL